MRLFFIAFFSALLTVPAAIAHESSEKSEKVDFQEMKKIRLEHIDKLRKCISNSKNYDQIKECKPMKRKMHKKNISNN